MLLTTHKYHALTPDEHLSNTLARKLAQPNHRASLQVNSTCLQSLLHAPQPWL